MATTATHLSEALQLGVGIMIICDECGRAIDKLGDEGFWRDLYESDKMYTGRALCPSCHEADVHEREAV